MGGHPLARLSTFAVHDLSERLRRDPRGLTVLDVRTEKEWNGGHIEGAIHIHGGQLQERFADVPRDKPVAVVCGSGYRASIAASFLKREGYEDVSNVMGGMTAWKAAELPTVNS
jgi:hydroxyacylglutathione hydrolase